MEGTKEGDGTTYNRHTCCQEASTNTNGVCCNRYFPKKLMGILTNDNPGGMTSPELMPPPASRASERQTHLFECPQCKKKFPTESRMMYHLEKHT